MVQMNPVYRIVEIFESLQGEGYNTGMPAIFIRLGRCDLACSWCDTDYLRYQSMSLREILQVLEQYTAKQIIITGGEPSIHPQLVVLLDALKARGYYLCIETNGLHQVPEQIDYIATSPKACYAERYLKDGGLTQADEVRIVVDVQGLQNEAEQTMQVPSHIQTKLSQESISLTPGTVCTENEWQFMQFAHAMAQGIKAAHYYLSPLEVNGQMNIHQTIRLIGLLNTGLLNMDKFSASEPGEVELASGRSSEQASTLATAAPVHWQLSVQTHKWAGIE